MRTFVITLGGKRKGELTRELLLRHVDHLRRLRAAGHLVLCGPFADDEGALQVLRAASEDEVRAECARDPLIAEGYYRTCTCRELYEGNEENNWLLDAAQTAANTKPE